MGVSRAEAPPSAMPVAMTSIETATAEASTAPRARRATSAASSRPAGHTLIQAPIASRAPPHFGWSAMSITATRATGTVMASMRPSAMGPSSTRKSIHHQATAARRARSCTPMIETSAAALSIMTSVSQVVP